jgi:signal transduction histidine kinase/ActR/RegA family two-component response regulator
MDSGFTQAYLHATLLVSLLSVWVLVGLFYYLNRYTKREYFTIWTAAWLFYALWLTLCLTWESSDPASLAAMIKQSCVALSAAFLLWGTLRFLDIAAPQSLFGLFMLFLVAWTFAVPSVATSALQIQLPVFILLGAGSIFAAACFFRMRKHLPYVGAGLLALGFLLWGVYLGVYPLAQQHSELNSIGYLVAAVLQLFIAVSMIVLVLEEVRYRTEKMREEMAAVRSEKEALEARVISTEEKVRQMYDQVRLTEGTQEAYNELRRTQGAVVQQERLRALGQMASGVAHDINNALSPITAYADLLARTEPGLAEKSRSYLLDIRRAADDVARIVMRMREFYRPRSNDEHLESVDVNSLVESVVEFTRPRWRDVPQRQGISIAVETGLDPALPPLVSDPSELREALINLVFNSVDALPQGGTIRLVTRFVPAPAGGNGSAPEAAPRVVIEVRDNGIGMDEKVRQRCLEPFFTTKSQRGTGLGLSMVYGIMQRHDGTIEIESAPGAGTVIRLLFPVRKAPVARTPVAAPSQKAPSALRILCIDDEPKIRRVLADCLEAYHHNVVLASSGREGLDLFSAAAAQRKPFDVVITDLGMPDLDGKQVARGIKAIAPRAPVVMMTGWGALMSEQNEHPAEVDAVVGKPPRLDELNTLLHRLAGSNRPTQTARVPAAPTIAG